MKEQSQKILFFLSLMILISGCNQNMLGTGYAVKNFISTPFRSIGNYFSNKAYKNFEEKNEHKAPIPSECWVKKKSVFPGLESLQVLTDAVRNDVCSCVPWGSCTTEECPCSRMCPEGFDIFKRPGVESTKDFSTIENSLSFINGGGGSKIRVTEGFCWGHASVTSQFNRLAFFNKNEIPEFDIYAKDETEQKKAMDYYKGLIDDIVENKPTKIPGIKNLFELSSIPGIEEYLADKVAHSWASKAMTFQGLNVAQGSDSMSMNESREFVSSIKKKIDQNQQPQIIFTKKNQKFQTHATLVSHYIENKDGSTTLCLRDNNRPRQMINLISNHCMDYMVIKDDGSILYSEIGDIGSARLAHNDNPDALTQLNNLKEHCDKEKGCNK